MAGASLRSGWARRTRSTAPFALYRLDDADAVARDSVGGRHGAYFGDYARADRGMRFGATDTPTYVEIPSSPAFSIGDDGMTVMFWVRPDTMAFTGTLAPLCPAGAVPASYVSIMNKHGNAATEPGTAEWLVRFYPDTAVDATCGEDRRGRLSAYAFNLTGGLGSGEYIQGPVTAGQWTHIIATFDPAGPAARVRMYVDSALKPLSSGAAYSQYSIVPGRGPAPVRIGGGSLESNPAWVQFRGTVADVAFYRGVWPFG
jgi:hypothetical protein